MNKTKQLRQLKHETLVRKILDLEKGFDADSKTIKRLDLCVVELTNRLDDVKMSNDVWKQKIERQKRQHSRAIRRVEIERDEWRLIAAEEVRLRLHVQHDFRVSNRRWEDEEERDEAPVKTDDTAERPVAKNPDG